MADDEKALKALQLRLAPLEDEGAAKVARERKISKNDVLRRALNLMLKVENETRAGGRLLLERNGPKGTESVELWLL
jgi:hypothetical protein